MTREEVQRAVRAWLTPGNLSDLLLLWRGRDNATSADSGRVALVEYARSCRDAADDQWLIETIEPLLNGEEASESANIFFPPPSQALRIPLEELRKRTERQNRNRTQLANLVLGLSHGVLAAVSWRLSQSLPGGDNLARRQQLEDRACEALARAGAHYDRAWMLTNRKVLKTVLDDLSSSDDARTLLKACRKSKYFSDEGMSYSTWLILHRLLEECQRNDGAINSTLKNAMFLGNLLHRNQVTAMLYQPSSNRGYLQRVELRAVSSDLDAVCLDPLAFGVTILDDAMQWSLRIAYRCCRQSLLAGIGRDGSVPAIHVVPTLPKSLGIISGGSAGGLFAAGMILTARRQDADSTRSATVGLALPPSDLDDDESPIAPESLQLTGVDHVRDKINEVKRLAKNLPFQEVFLCTTYHDNWASVGDNVSSSLQVSKVDNLGKLVEGLRGSAADEEVLQLHTKNVGRVWSRIAKADSDKSTPTDRDINDEHRLGCYVPPSYYIEGPLTSGVGEPIHQYATDVVPGDADRPIWNLLQLLLTGRPWPNASTWISGGKGLLIYDVAGSGKTVATLKIQDLLASDDARTQLFGGRDPLIMRCEGMWPRTKNGELASLRSAIGMFLRNDIKSRPHSKRVVNYALEQRRVIIIVDGFDQLSPAEIQHLSKMFNKPGPEQHLARDMCHWIITSRIHMIDLYRSDLFDDARWTRVRIDRFSEQQQDQYFVNARECGSVNANRWREVVPNRHVMGELLSLPLVLRMILRLIDLTPTNVKLPVFHTLSDLYLITTRMLLERARQKSREGVDVELTQRGITLPRDYKGNEIRLLEHVLSLIAFQFMLLQEFNGQLNTAKEVEAFERVCRKRFLYELDTELTSTLLTPSDRKGVEKRLDEREKEWLWALEMLRKLDLHHRSVTELFAKDRVKFRSRKMVECHAARYLTQYATEWDIFGARESQDFGGDPFKRCAWHYTNEPQWNDCWRLAIDMPRVSIDSDPEAKIDPSVTCQSLSALFRQPPHEIRPTELMYWAWHLFEVDDRRLRDHLFIIEGNVVSGGDLSTQERRRRGNELVLPGAAGIMKLFRETSIELVARIDTESAKLQVPYSDSERQQWLAAWGQQESGHGYRKSHTMLHCPPQSWIEEIPEDQRDPLANPCVGWQGATDGDTEADSDEKPGHWVRITPFRIQATPVTLRQYALFDTAFVASNAETLFGGTVQEVLSNYLWSQLVLDNNDSDCWEHPVIATTWYDSWVFCKWLGRDYHLPSESEQEFAIRGGSRHKFCFDDSSQQLSDYAWYSENSSGKVHPVGEKLPNHFGLFDVHGSVWQWCQDWYALYENRTETGNVVSAELGPSSGSRRVSRGGSWGSSARRCRASVRGGDHPACRWRYQGFRVASVPASIEARGAGGEQERRPGGSAAEPRLEVRRAWLSDRR